MRQSLIWLCTIPVLALILAGCDDPKKKPQNNNNNNNQVCPCGITLETINGQPLDSVTHLVEGFDDQDSGTAGFQITVVAKVATEGVTCVPPDGSEVTLFGGVQNVKVPLAGGEAVFEGYTIPSGSGVIDLHARVPDCQSSVKRVNLGSGAVPECRILGGVAAGQPYSCPDDDEAPTQLGLQRTIVARCVDVPVGTPVRFLIDDNLQGEVNLGANNAAEFGVTLPVTAICRDSVTVSIEVGSGAQILTDSVMTGQACCEGQIPCSLRWEAGLDYFAGAPAGLHALNISTDLDDETPGHQSNFRLTTHSTVTGRIVIYGDTGSGTLAPLCTQANVTANQFSLPCTVPDGTVFLKPVCYTREDNVAFEDVSQAHHVIVDTIAPPPVDNFACTVTNAREADITCTWTIPGSGEALGDSPVRFTHTYDEAACLADTAGLFGAGWSTLDYAPGYVSPMGAGLPGDDRQFVFSPFVPGPGYCLGLRAKDRAGNPSETVVRSWSGAVVPEMMTINGYETISNFGTTIASADLNCDGRKDLIVGASTGSECWYQPGSTCEGDGKVYIYFASDSGFPDTPDITLTLDPDEPDLGGGTYAYFGDTVSGIGNFSGHFDSATDSALCEDIIIGAPWMYYEDNENILNVWPGRAFLLKGRPLWNTNVITTSPDDPNGFDAVFNYHKSDMNYAGFFNYYEEFGTYVSAIGDFNGDGIGDLAISAPGAMPSGAVYVFTGRPIPFKGLNPPVIINAPEDAYAQILGTANIGSSANSEVDYEFFGRTISALGDFDDDGFDDFIIGAPGCGGWWGYGSQPGKAVLVSGGTGEIIDTSNIPSSRISFVSQSPNVLGTRCFGWSVAGIGDFNQNGNKDFAVSDNFYDIPASTPFREGAVFVFFGDGSISDRQTDNSDIRIRSEWPLTTHDNFGVSIGTSVSTINTPMGDFNNDGITDLLIGARRFGENHGSAFIWFGTNDYSSSSDWITYEESSFWFIPPSDFGLWGFYVVWLGDTNNDGYSDIAIGDPYWDFMHNSTPSNPFFGRVTVIK